ncbi:uncharacterized protein LOC116192851 [Punica granatum]|nr:uncharacterized protein LOC116192851 [Punica granatum]
MRNGGKKYDAKGWTEKGAHKYGRLNEQSWWEKWGEHYDGRGSVLKWTDKWAETELGTKWGDKWEENFFAGIGRSLTTVRQMWLVIRRSCYRSNPARDLPEFSRISTLDQSLHILRRILLTPLLPSSQGEDLASKFDWPSGLVAGLHGFSFSFRWF